MLGHVVMTCDLLGDVGGREGEVVILVTAIPKKPRGLAGLHFYSWALSPPISDGRGVWARFDIDWPFYSNETAFLFPETITFVCHNHIVQTSLVTGKGIWFYFSSKSNGVQEARLWCCVGFPSRESADDSESQGTAQAHPKAGFGFCVLPQSCLEKQPEKNGKKKQPEKMDSRVGSEMSFLLQDPSLLTKLSCQLCSGAPARQRMLSRCTTTYNFTHFFCGPLGCPFPIVRCVW